MSEPLKDHYCVGCRKMLTVGGLKPTAYDSLTERTLVFCARECAETYVEKRIFRLERSIEEFAIELRNITYKEVEP